MKVRLLALIGCLWVGSTGAAPSHAASYPILAGTSSFTSTGSASAVVDLPAPVDVDYANPQNWISLASSGSYAAIAVQEVGTFQKLVMLTLPSSNCAVGDAYCSEELTSVFWEVAGGRGGPPNTMRLTGALIVSILGDPGTAVSGTIKLPQLSGSTAVAPSGAQLANFSERVTTAEGVDSRSGSYQGATGGLGLVLSMQWHSLGQQGQPEATTHCMHLASRAADPTHACVLNQDAGFVGPQADFSGYSASYLTPAGPSQWQVDYGFEGVGVGTIAGVADLFLTWPVVPSAVGADGGSQTLAVDTFQSVQDQCGYGLPAIYSQFPECGQNNAINPIGTFGWTFAGSAQPDGTMTSSTSATGAPELASEYAFQNSADYASISLPQAQVRVESRFTYQVSSATFCTGAGTSCVGPDATNGLVRSDQLQAGNGAGASLTPATYTSAVCSDGSGSPLTAIQLDGNPYDEYVSNPYTATSVGAHAAIVDQWCEDGALLTPGTFGAGLAGFTYAISSQGTWAGSFSGHLDPVTFVTT
ncbi:MAG: hypothetical protein ACYDAY_11150 [Candidatus Dormibacteria bacterium]